MPSGSPLLPWPDVWPPLWSQWVGASCHHSSPTLRSCLSVSASWQDVRSPCSLVFALEADRPGLLREKLHDHYCSQCLSLTRMQSRLCGWARVYLMCWDLHQPVLPFYKVGGVALCSPSRESPSSNGHLPVTKSDAEGHRRDWV